MPPAGRCTGDTLDRWLAYADDVCILAESKTELSAILIVFTDFLTDDGMVLSAEKSFWMTLGCSVDVSDREAIQLPCGPVKYTESFKYLGVVLTSELTDMADIDTKLSCGRGTFKSLSKMFCSTALPVKLRAVTWSKTVGLRTRFV